jgi:hypothetical protein
MRKLSYIIALTMVLTMGLATAWASPQKFELTVSPGRGTVDDTFFATVTVAVAGVGGPNRYWAPGFKGFIVVDKKVDRSSATQVDPKLGRVLVTTDVHRYVLKPKYAGNFSINPARVRLPDGDFETKSAFVTVTPGRGPLTPDAPEIAPTRAPDPTAAGGIGAPGFSPPDPATYDDVFIHVVADKRRPFHGEQVTVTWLLYSRKEILKFEARSHRLDSIWTETLFEPTGFFKYHETLVGRRRYSVTIVAKKAVFPTRRGLVRVAPFVADVVVLGAAQGKSTRVRSRPLALNVRGLPKNAPDGFESTYIGSFDAKASLERTELGEGESTVLELRVSGLGAIRRQTIPQLEFEGFEVTAPSDYDEKVDTTRGQVSGIRSYRYWIKPEEKGAQTLPAIEIPYFDPSKGRYEVAKTRPMPLLVGETADKRVERSNVRENVISRDIRLIRTGAVESRILPTLYTNIWFWLLLVFPPFGYVTVVGVDRLRRHLRRETPRARLRRARGRARKYLRVAEIHLRGDRANKFFAQLARALHEFLDERLEQPVQSMTRDELALALREHGFSPAMVGQITRELDECDYARFSSGKVSRKDMQAALDRVQRLLKTLEQASDAEVLP